MLEDLAIAAHWATDVEIPTLKESKQRKKMVLSVTSCRFERGQRRSVPSVNQAFRLPQFLLLWVWFSQKIFHLGLQLLIGVFP